MMRRLPAAVLNLALIAGALAASSLSAGDCSGWCLCGTTTIDGCSGYRVYSRCCDGRRQYGCYDVGVAPDATYHVVGSGPSRSIWERNYWFCRSRCR